MVCAGIMAVACTRLASAARGTCLGRVDDEVNVARWRTGIEHDRLVLVLRTEVRRTWDCLPTFAVAMLLM